MPTEVKRKNGSPKVELQVVMNHSIWGAENQAQVPCKNNKGSEGLNHLPRSPVSGIFEAHWYDLLCRKDSFQMSAFNVKALGHLSP